MWIPPISGGCHQCSISSLGRLDGVLTIELFHLPLISGGTWDVPWRGLFAEGTSKIGLLLIGFLTSIVTPEASLASISLRQYFSISWVLSWPSEDVTLPVTLLSCGDWVMQSSIPLLQRCLIISHHVGPRKGIGLSHSQVFRVLGGLLYYLGVSLGSENI